MLGLHMTQRGLESRIKEALQRSSAAALMGPRQVGKTIIKEEIKMVAWSP